MDQCKVRACRRMAPVEWYEDADNRTHAGFAFHIYKLIDQYEYGMPNVRENERYEATLSLCCLHGLLVNLSELYKGVVKNKPEWFSCLITPDENEWGLKRGYIEDWYSISEKMISIKELFNSLRDSVSHPTKNHSRFNRTTGYSVVSENRLIKSVRFVHGPLTDAQSGALAEYSIDRIKSTLSQSIGKDWKQYFLVDDKDEKTLILRGGKVVIPTMVCNIPVRSLVKMTKMLAAHLAQPAIRDWDGRKVLDLDTTQLAA